MKNLLHFALLILPITFAQSQNVGVGTATPQAKLDVVGTIKITDGTQGAGKILTSNANGLASWQSFPPASDYHAVAICCQTWMGKNLDVTTYRNGDPIPKVTNDITWSTLTTGAYCYYNNDSATYAAVYGKLYNWYAVNDPRGLAPAGWHIPSDLEWTTLANCLGGSSVAGGILKELGLAHWLAPNAGASNLGNFTALPGGGRLSDGSFFSINEFAIWYASTEYDTDSAWNRFARHHDTFLTSPVNDKHSGFSVRCVKD